MASMCRSAIFKNDILFLDVVPVVMLLFPNDTALHQSKNNSNQKNHLIYTDLESIDQSLAHPVS